MWPLASDGQGCSTPRPAPILNATKICLWNDFPRNKTEICLRVRTHGTRCYRCENVGFAETRRDFHMLGES